MDTIKNYLENMFLNLPKTEEVLRAKAELADMMEDKYYELLNEGKTDNEAVGIVISEFGNLKELSKELGIDEIVSQKSNAEYADKENSNRVLSSKEVKEYLENVKSFYHFIGIGVMLCIYSPIILITLGAIEEGGFFGKDMMEKLEVCIGIPCLLILIAIATGIFIYQGMKNEKCEYLKKEIFSLDLGLEKEIRTEFEEKKPVYTMKIIVGTVLCILSVIPVIMLGVIAEDADFLQAMSVVVLLGIIGIAVFLFVTAGGEQDGYHVLLQDGDYTKVQKKANVLAKQIESVYWVIITAIYLMWSFSTQNWHYTWIIWPIAGVLSVLISYICKWLEKAKEDF